MEPIHIAYRNIDERVAALHLIDPFTTLFTLVSEKRKLYEPYVRTLCDYNERFVKATEMADAHYRAAEGYLNGSSPDSMNRLQRSVVKFVTDTKTTNLLPDDNAWIKNPIDTAFMIAQYYWITPLTVRTGVMAARSLVNAIRSYADAATYITAHQLALAGEYDSTVIEQARLDAIDQAFELIS